jgi:hypothetical protein
MKCPLFITSKLDEIDCLEEECAWFHIFDLGKGRCSLVSIATNGDDMMSELDNDLDHINETLKKTNTNLINILKYLARGR